MTDHDDITPAQAAQIEKRIGQTFDFVRDMIDDPLALELIPNGSSLTFRDVVIQQTRVRLTAYPANDQTGYWIARVTGPAQLAIEGRNWRSQIETEGVAGKWGSPPTSPERGETAAAALDALEAKLRDADHPEWIPRRAVGS
jgi:hypothetical protein